MRPLGDADRILRIVESEEVPDILSVYLFGSRAEGREHAESDIDLGVLLDRNIVPLEEERFHRRLSLTAAFSAYRGPTADVVILNDCPPTLGRAIVHRGIRIFCRDELADRAYRRDVQLQAADLDIFLRRMRTIKLEALAR